MESKKMNNDFDFLRDLVIGTVEFVCPSEIKVLLEINAPQNTAINTGTPTLFPKINGFLLIPNEAGALVGIISWVGVEYSQYPKRKGFKDFDLVDLPFPQRRLSLNPLGILRNTPDGYRLERGVYSYPSVGDVVVIPTMAQLSSIVENKETNARIQIGVSPLAANAPVHVNPDKLFGRHLAVLGNTGSGKSCSVAGLIRWSIEAAKKEKHEDGNINARFIVLDPNGEYTTSFDDLSKDIRKFKVKIESESDEYKQLKVPVWMWNSYEWSSITQASGRTQRPLLRRALREVRGGPKGVSTFEEGEIYRYFSSLQVTLRNIKKSTPSSISEFPGKQNFGELIYTVRNDLDSFISDSTGDLKSKLEIIQNKISDILDSHKKSNSGYYPAFEIKNIDDIIDAIDNLAENVGSLKPYKGPDEDSPVPFNGEVLINHIERLAQEKNALQYIDFFLMRIRTMLSDQRMASIIGTEDSENNDSFLSEWLEDYVGGNNAENGEIAIIDLSLVPSEIIYIIIAVIARIVFEALQRYKKMSNELLPTVLILEEAHTFICRYTEGSDEIYPAKMCTQTFEKIAREGRKFGLGLVISSQRPSELSPTVLSQCNTFLLHRIVNDRDQELVKRLVPDSLGGFLEELPVLPTRKAILLGWASPIPILVEMKELGEKQRPRSEDPRFWDVWTGKKERKIDWSKIADDWQGEKGEKGNETKEISNNDK